MGTDPGFWHRLDDEQSAARFGAEHGLVGSFDGEVLELHSGNEELLPEWPPTVNLPHLTVPLHPEPAPLRAALCSNCGSALKKREGEWRHECGWKARGGCTEATPTE